MSKQPNNGARLRFSSSKTMKLRRRRTFAILGFVVGVGVAVLSMQLFGSDRYAGAETVGNQEKPPVQNEEVVTPEQPIVPEEPIAPEEPVVPPSQGGSPVEEKVPMSTYNDEQKVAYLTIDDGPSAVTNQLLDVLDQFGIKATFFMIEPRMEQYPDSVKRLVEEGHMPGMHGVTHQVKKVYASAQSVTAEMQAGRDKVKELTGFEPSLIRVPYGSKPHMKPDYKEAVKSAGFMMWDWNVDSLDWKFKDARYVDHVVAQVEKLEAQGENPIILIHDTKNTLNHLPSLLQKLIDKGYKFELLHNRIEPLQFK